MKFLTWTLPALNLDISIVANRLQIGAISSESALFAKVSVLAYGMKGKTAHTIIRTYRWVYNGCV